MFEPFDDALRATHKFVLGWPGSFQPDDDPGKTEHEGLDALKQRGRAFHGTQSQDWYDRSAEAVFTPMGRHCEVVTSCFLSDLASGDLGRHSKK